MSKPDFHYHTNGPERVILWPLNSQSEALWREMTTDYPGGGMTLEQFKSVRKHLKDSGYIVHKHPARGLK